MVARPSRAACSAVPAPKGAGLTGVAFHTPRHACASILIEAGLSPLRLQRWMATTPPRSRSRCTATYSTTTSDRHSTSDANWAQPNRRLLSPGGGRHPLTLGTRPFRTRLRAVWPRDSPASLPLLPRRSQRLAQCRFCTKVAPMSSRASGMGRCRVRGGRVVGACSAWRGCGGSGVRGGV